MYYHSKYRINSEMKMIHLLEENHLLLLMLQHFEIDFRVRFDHCPVVRNMTSVRIYLSELQIYIAGKGE